MFPRSPLTLQWLPTPLLKQQHVLQYPPPAASLLSTSCYPLRRGLGISKLDINRLLQYLPRPWFKENQSPFPTHAPNCSTNGVQAVLLACLSGIHKFFPLCSLKGQPPRKGLSSAPCLPTLCLDLETLLGLISSVITWNQNCRIGQIHRDCLVGVVSGRSVWIWVYFCSSLWPNSISKHKTLAQASYPKTVTPGSPATCSILTSGVGSGCLETEASFFLCLENRKVGAPRLSACEWRGLEWQESDFRRFISSHRVAPIACTFGLTGRNKIGLLSYPSKVTELCLKRIIYSYYNWIDKCRLNW